MLVYGKNVAREVLQNDYVVKKIYLLDNFKNEEILELIKRKNCNVVKKTMSELDKMSSELHQGIIIDVKDYKYTEFEYIKRDIDSNFIVILDHVEDPRNFGAVIRTCECAGVNYIIIPNKRSVDINETVMKTSSGALTNVNICQVANLGNTIDKLKELGYWIVGTDSKGEDYSSIDYSSKIALIIGSEGNGLKMLTRSKCDYIASIPLKGKVNSLNASVAAGIMIYQVLSSRGNK